MGPKHFPYILLFPIGHDKHPAIVQVSHPNFYIHFTQSPKIGSKKVPSKQKLFIVCLFFYVTMLESATLFITLFNTSSYFTLFVMLVLCKVKMSPLSDIIELSLPPVLLI